MVPFQLLFQINRQTFSTHFPLLFLFPTTLTPVWTFSFFPAFLLLFSYSLFAKRTNSFSLTRSLCICLSGARSISLALSIFPSLSLLPSIFFLTPLSHTRTNTHQPFFSLPRSFSPTFLLSLIFLALRTLSTPPSNPPAFMRACSRARALSGVLSLARSTYIYLYIYM